VVGYKRCQGINKNAKRSHGTTSGEAQDIELSLVRQSCLHSLNSEQ